MSSPSKTGHRRMHSLWFRHLSVNVLSVSLSLEHCNLLGERFLREDGRREGSRGHRGLGWPLALLSIQLAQQLATLHSVSPCFCWFPCEYITCPPKLISPILFDDQHLCLSRVTASLTSPLPGPFFSLPFLPSPSSGQTVPFVQGASGLDGRPGPPVSVTSPSPLHPPHPTPPHSWPISPFICPAVASCFVFFCFIYFFSKSWLIPPPTPKSAICAQFTSAYSGLLTKDNRPSSSFPCS